jgi:type I restriction enzyme S subunit
MSKERKLVWPIRKLSEIATVQTGLAKNKSLSGRTIERPYLRVANVQDGYLDLSEVKAIRVRVDQAHRFSLRYGDVLFTEGGDFDKLGRGCVWREQVENCLHQNHIFAVRTNRDFLLPEFLSIVAESSIGKNYFIRCSKKSTNLASINSGQLKQMPVPVPSMGQQCAIVSVSQTFEASDLLARRRLTAFEQLKSRLICDLLTGHRRFPSFESFGTRTHSLRLDFPKDWTLRTVGAFANEVNATAPLHEEATVLSSTKHDGLVDSLEYFGRRVYSDDTSNYKLVKRGQFAYATNHIEEGSIGLLMHRDEGLVSPMYTVFEVTGDAVPEYLFPLFKSDHYLHLFRAMTNGSVNRRGGLRWSDFKTIKVALPSKAEQMRIIELLKLIDHEIVLLKRLKQATEKQKRGVMERLLTGEVTIPDHVVERLNAEAAQKERKRVKAEAKAKSHGSNP